MNPPCIAKSLVPSTFKLPPKTGGMRILKADLQDSKLRVRDAGDWRRVAQTPVGELSFSTSLQGNSIPGLLLRKHTLFLSDCPAFMQAAPLPECPFPALHDPRPLALQGPTQISLPFKTSPVLLQSK